MLSGDPPCLLVFLLSTVAPLGPTAGLRSRCARRDRKSLRSIRIDILRHAARLTAAPRRPDRHVLAPRTRCLTQNATVTIPNRRSQPSLRGSVQRRFIAHGSAADDKTLYVTRCHHWTYGDVRQNRDSIASRLATNLRQRTIGQVQVKLLVKLGGHTFGTVRLVAVFAVLGSER